MNREKNAFPIPLATLFGAACGTAYFFFLRPQLLRWGTRLGESQRRLPGDDLIPDPNRQGTRAINIDAPPEAVWPWLAQMGRNRTGWYSFDLLYNNGIPSATYLRSDLPSLQIGAQLDSGLQVMALEENRLLLLAGYDRPNEFGAANDTSLLYLLERQPDGSTRLLVRNRTCTYGLAGTFQNVALEAFDFAVIARQLLVLKQRAETMAYLKSPPAQVQEIALN